MLGYALLGIFIDIAFQFDALLSGPIETKFYFQLALAFVIALLRVLYRVRTGHYQRDPRLGMF